MGPLLGSFRTLGGRNLPMSGVYGSAARVGLFGVRGWGRSAALSALMLGARNASSALRLLTKPSPHRGHPCCPLSPTHSTLRAYICGHSSFICPYFAEGCGGTTRLLSLSPTTLTAPFAIPDDTDASARADPLVRVFSVQVCFCAVLPVQTDVPPPRRIPD